MDSDGVQYAATDLTPRFLAYMDASYANRLRESAAWVARRFGAMSDAELDRYVTARLDRWGGEFSSESLVREVTL
jgi:hypothetical protein